MSDRFLSYLEREQARLDGHIAAYLERPDRNEFEVARLMRAQLIAQRQLRAWRAEVGTRAST